MKESGDPPIYTCSEPRHALHSYFNVCPESPDGRFVLFYASSAPDGHFNLNDGVFTRLVVAEVAAGGDS
jgi:hypothetical protein